MMKENYQNEKKKGKTSKYIRKGQLNIFMKKYFKIKNRLCGRIQEETKKEKKKIQPSDEKRKCP